MALPTGSKPQIKKPKSRFARSLVGRYAHAVFGRVFCKRSIIIIAEHGTQHVPFSARSQLLATVGAIAFVIWASYSSGSYMAAQEALKEKERKLASSNQETQRVAAEFTLLKSDLLKLADAAKSGKSGDYAKQLAAQYSNTSVTDKVNVATAGDEGSQVEAVFKRVEMLDNKVRELQQTHDEMIADIRSMTGGKIRELENVIARTGLSGQSLVKTVEAKRAQEEQEREKYGRAQAAGERDNDGKGGPYIPVRESALKTKETELYYNLQRMMALNEVVSNLPTDIPMRGDFKKTSGFGVRTDPFHGGGAFHSGVDFSGPVNTKIYATSDGNVEFAGWKSDYGNVVDIKHQYGLSTRYAHMSRILVAPEQFVKKGQVIGLQGSTGRSTGKHLHYEVRYNGKALNPANFLKAGENVQAVN